MIIPSTNWRIAVDFHPTSLRHRSLHVRTQLLVARLSWIDDVRSDHDVKVSKAFPYIKYLRQIYEKIKPFSLNSFT